MNQRYAVLIKYSAFAALAIVVNLGAQRVLLSLGNHYFFYGLAVFVGTALGLVVKYVLDKKWIFYDVDQNLKKSAHQFTLYTVTGVVTTAIFWSTETVFWLVWGNDSMRELGAVIGLTIGYVTKYWLDRRYVFNKAQPDSMGLL